MRYQCSTNSYGPEDSILRRCDSKCHKTLKEGVEVYTEDGEITKIENGNPSLADDLCAQFRREKLQDAMTDYRREMAGDKLDKQGFSLDEKFNFLGWIKIADSDNHTITCYPHLHSEGLDTAREMWDLPYKHGWCEVGDRLLIDVCDTQLIIHPCQVCSGEEMSGPGCAPSPGSGWGWCQVREAWCSQSP